MEIELYLLMGKLYANINITNEEVVKLLKGRKKSKVKIKIKRSAVKEKISPLK